MTAESPHLPGLDEVEVVSEALKDTSLTTRTATFSDMSDREVEIIAEALKGTTWLALFSRVSKTCRSAAVRAANDEASLRRLRVSDVVCSVELVKWAIDQGYPRKKGPIICAFAARGGYLDILKLVRNSGFDWGVDTCSFAAEGGHLEVLKWARANGCPWNEDVCPAAAYFGHLDVLKWAMANGCEWTVFSSSFRFLTRTRRMIHFA